MEIRKLIFALLVKFVCPIDNLNQKRNEYFIALIYQQVIEKAFNVKLTRSKYVKVFWTPKELSNSFKKSFYELLGENSWSG